MGEGEIQPTPKINFRKYTQKPETPPKVFATVFLKRTATARFRTHGIVI